MQVNYMWLNDSIVLNYSGKTVAIAAGDSRYERILGLIRENALEGIPAIVEENERLFSGGRMELIDGLIHIDGTALPDELSSRILKFKEANLPFDALLKFWDNLKVNPSFNARRMLFQFLEHNGHPLTQDGCFIAYRGVTEDFKDLHTRSFDNKPGSVCEIPRTAVDDNPNNTCSTGLHVACHEYAKGFGPKLIEVKVNPADVVCVPTDYNGTKMRVCRFEVISEGENIRTEELYPDDSDETPEYSEVENTCAECGEETDGSDLCYECDEDTEAA